MCEACPEMVNHNLHKLSCPLAHEFGEPTPECLCGDVRASRTPEGAAPAYVEWYGKQRRQDWRTPKEFFIELDHEYRFDLDGAADSENSLCAEGSTLDSPVSWVGRRVFCNPPWSDIASFVELAPHAEIAVLLVPARTNAAWFHRALSLGAAVRFFPKRLKFVRAGGVPQGKGHNSPVDCLLLVWGG